MDTIRKRALWAGGLFVCAVAMVIGVRAANSEPVKADVSVDVNEAAKVMRLDEVPPEQLVPIPESYNIVTHYPDGDPRNSPLAGTLPPLTCQGEPKVIYNSPRGQFLFRPKRGILVADDIITELITDCTICSMRVRVTGGVQDGDGEFSAEISLYDGCPDPDAGGQLIPGTRKTFTGLADDIGQFHDLVFDFDDRGICTDGTACAVSQQNCGDGTECVPDPLQIPAEVWLRLRFNTDSAAVVVGSPPIRGFSADGYDDQFGTCRNFFGGWPEAPHATFYAEILAPQECPTHFLAYLAADPSKTPVLPNAVQGGTPTARMADDINLTVDNCELSAFELGIVGTQGPYRMDIDLRWPDLVRDENIRTYDHDGGEQNPFVFEGRGEGSVEVAHFTLPPELVRNIDRNNQPILITWKPNIGNTGVPEVNITQAGVGGPNFFVQGTDRTDPDWPLDWAAFAQTDGTNAVFYAAIYCRGDAPRGACCPDQQALPGLDLDCFDDVAVTSCLGSRWQINSTCEDNAFNPPCGTHACCLSNDNCEDRIFDDCAVDCITDSFPIECHPVCVGGTNVRAPCTSDLDCPGGVCDPDGLCPGLRTCGLTGCMLDGQFTGRPCDPNNGADDCMTCSISGNYCRPRCVGGTENGRPCDPLDALACPGLGDPPPFCDVDADCPGAETCAVQTQTCETDPNLCGLRCAQWFEGIFCNDDQTVWDGCPPFACFNASGDCFEATNEVQCFGRCYLHGNPTGETCWPSDPCSGEAICVPSDEDCPPGRQCLFDFAVCTGREGCDNLICCDAVCSRRPVCCDGSQGDTWDSSCVSEAANNCEFPPGNDNCYSERPNEGAFEIALEDNDGPAGAPCTPESTSCSGSRFAGNDFATSSFENDPDVCCNKLGVNRAMVNTIWFKFKANHTSARVHTCNTPGSLDAVDSIIQVYRATIITDNGNDFDECNSLEVIGCNDDGGGSACGEQASVCVNNLTVGETYYVMMGSSTGAETGRYEIDVQSPCPVGTFPGPQSVCEDAEDLTITGSATFDLTDANFDCPAESCLGAMSNDLWFEFRPDCTGNLVIQTCGYNLPAPTENPGTTLAVYKGDFCPPVQLVGCSDDATIDPICSIGGAACDTAADCNVGCRVTGGPCDNDNDCPGTDTCDLTLLATCETTPDGLGASTGTSCTVDDDCTRGRCENNNNLECDVSQNGIKVCVDGTTCINDSFCIGHGTPARCGPCGTPDTNIPNVCEAQEACEPASCVSACAPASYVAFPVFFTDPVYKIRVGGEFGSEPSGTIRAACVPDDCNNNGLPDLFEIEFGLAQDCNRNDEPDQCDIDSGFSNDCNCNSVPDECEIDAADVIDCSIVTGPCDDGPFYCSPLDTVCDADINHNGIPDCCDEGVPPDFCPDCPGGACCDAGGCSIVDPADCTGVYVGDGVACEADTCTLGSCCQGDQTCRDAEVASQCTAAGETFRPGVDCTTTCGLTCSMTDLTEAVFADDNGVPADSFERAGNCAIDARRPHDPADQLLREGWDRLVLSFSCDPTGLNLVPGDFSVSVLPLPPPAAPGVASVVTDNGLNTVTITLDAPISPEQWTCITHTASGNEWCAGSLPADSGQDRLSSSADIGALINAINLVPGQERPMYATDIDRSGLTTATDILRLIDLLNGAGNFDPWITKQLPPCPNP